jgi:hypothetical protein
VQPRDIVEAYLDAIARHDIDAARGYLADTGFHYESPLASFDSADAFMEYNALNMGILQGIEPIKTFVDGPDVCTVMVLTIQISEKERVKVVNWCRVEGGRVVRMEVVFDTRIYHTLFETGDGGQR